MSTQQVSLDKLADAIGQIANNLVGILATELSAEQIERAPSDTAQLVESIQVSPRRPLGEMEPDTRRPAKATSASNGIKQRIIKKRRAEALRAAQLGAKSKVWFITMRLPYGTEVNKGTPNQMRLKNQPRHVQRAAFAAMRRKASERGEAYPPYTKRENKRDFFRISNRDISKAMRQALRINKRLKVKV